MWLMSVAKVAARLAIWLAKLARLAASTGSQTLPHQLAMLLSLLLLTIHELTGRVGSRRRVAEWE